MVWNIPKKHDRHGLMHESLYILHLKIIIFGVYTWVIQHTLIDSMTEMQARELFHVFCHPNNEQDVTSQSWPLLPAGPPYRFPSFPTSLLELEKRRPWDRCMQGAVLSTSPGSELPNRLSESIYIRNRWFSNTQLLVHRQSLSEQSPWLQPWRAVSGGLKSGRRTCQTSKPLICLFCAATFEVLPKC